MYHIDLRDGKINEQISNNNMNAFIFLHTTSLVTFATSFTALSLEELSAAQECAACIPGADDITLCPSHANVEVG